MKNFIEELEKINIKCGCNCCAAAVERFKFLLLKHREELKKRAYCPTGVKRPHECKKSVWLEDIEELLGEK